MGAAQHDGVRGGHALGAAVHDGLGPRPVDLAGLYQLHKTRQANSSTRSSACIRLYTSSWKRGYPPSPGWPSPAPARRAGRPGPA